MTFLNNAHLVDMTALFVLPVLVGMGLGIIHFGGLWWTVQQLTTARYPARMSLSSMVVRWTGTLAGLYWVMDGQWERLISCVIGFIAARTVLVRRFGPIREERSVDHKRSYHQHGN
jgi:F1F0 ATPase subunit 2